MVRDLDGTRFGWYVVWIVWYAVWIVWYAVWMVRDLDKVVLDLA
jgi:hypothetical protein